MSMKSPGNGPWTAAAEGVPEAAGLGVPAEAVRVGELPCTCTCSATMTMRTADAGRGMATAAMVRTGNPSTVAKRKSFRRTCVSPLCEELPESRVVDESGALQIAHVPEHDGHGPLRELPDHSVAGRGANLRDGREHLAVRGPEPVDERPVIVIARLGGQFGHPALLQGIRPAGQDDSEPACDRPDVLVEDTVLLGDVPAGLLDRLALRALQGLPAGGHLP